MAGSPQQPMGWRTHRFPDMAMHRFALPRVPGP